MNRKKTAGILVGLLVGLWAVVAQAATFNVTKFDDTADSKCNDDCSLREAIIAANAAPGADFVFIPAGNYVLTRSGNGEDLAATGDLDISGDLTIRGADASSTVIDGNAAGADNETDRVFDVIKGNVTISGVTVQNGNPLPRGGGVTGVSNPGFSGGGGGILVGVAANLTLSKSIVSGNHESFGGGVASHGSLFVDGCTISDNEGGAVAVDTDGNLAITNSTIANNSGGLGTLFIIEKGNQAAEITNVTIANNGGDRGIIAYGAGANLKNTILATNGLGDNCYGPVVSLGHNLFDDNTCSRVSGDVVANPLLGSLKNNGGPTPTQALKAGSPAVDAGDGCPSEDQRGADRPGGAACDIGAFEVNTAYTPVNTTPLAVDHPVYKSSQDMVSKLQPKAVDMFPKELCGNGKLNSGEECDDGNKKNGDGCSAVCRNEPFSKASPSWSRKLFRK